MFPSKPLFNCIQNSCPVHPSLSHIRLFFPFLLSFSQWLVIFKVFDYIYQVSVIACEVDWQVCGAWQQSCNGDECLKPPDLTVTQEQLPR